MRRFNQVKALRAFAALALAALACSVQAQTPMEPSTPMGRVISSTPLVQPNHSQPTAYNVIYEYAGKQYSVQMPRDPGSFVQLQVTPVGDAQTQQFEQNVTIPAPVIQPQTVYAPLVQQVVYAPAPVVYQQPYYVNPYIYPAIGIGCGLPRWWASAALIKNYKSPKDFLSGFFMDIHALRESR
jgi:hypothetical protein